MGAKCLTHVYYGYGKGKTTAALGLAIRAAGHGKKVVIVQFLKDTDVGELRILARLPEVTVYRGKAPGGMFTRDMTDEERAETRRIHDGNLKKAIELQQRGECDMLILDEALDALDLELLDNELFADLIRNKPDDLELVITGHRGIDWVFECADYVTEMAKHKHPYDLGIKGRRGVEF